MPLLRALLLSHARGNVDHKLKEIMRILLARFAGDKYFASLRSRKAHAMGLTETRIDEGSFAYEDDGKGFSEAEKCALRYADLVYDGLWISPLKNALDAFVDQSQEYVSGDVRLRCELPGRCIVAGRRSDVSLYDYSLATYEAADRFRHQDAEGFVRLWGLGIETWAARQVQQVEQVEHVRHVPKDS